MELTNVPVASLCQYIVFNLRDQETMQDVLAIIIARTP